LALQAEVSFITQGAISMTTRSLTLGALAFAALASGAALAQSDNKSGDMAKPAMEKCYGVSMAGKNDCAAGPRHHLRGHIQGGLPG
jgi:uncharacterized membrane protein